MNKRGWLASGLLAAAVIGGYLGLLPLLSSLAAGPAWPDPIASRAAAPAVTMGTSLSNGEPSGEAQAPSVVANGPTRTDEPTETDASRGGGAEPVVNEPKKQKSEVTVVVSGGLERVTKPKPAIQVTPRTNGGSGGGSSSGDSSSGRSSAGGGSTGGGSATPQPPVTPGALDDLGAGSLAGGPPDNGDDAPTAGG